MVNESLHLARLGRGLHHETNPPYIRADDQEAQDRCTADCLVQDRRCPLSSSGGSKCCVSPGSSAEQLRKSLLR
jgi:hypothetical protein